MASIDYSTSDTILNGNNDTPQHGNLKASESISNLNSNEFQKLNKLIQKERNKKNVTILDMRLGDVINNTINFLSNSVNKYHTKLMEAEFTQTLYTTDNNFLMELQKHLMAIVFFIRDEDNIIYIGILMIIFSVLICFFNISRSYGITPDREITK